MTLAALGNFFGLDTLIIILVVLLMFGGKKIPEVARSVGAAIREFRKGKDQDNLNHPHP
ncbi:MAG: hypothetical protein QOE70_6817 [Chthoniobacter sp.]|jgi:sec-independent protein translocase protein TatA|nr:hypothetical protein [Chthoniobacter sp.]